MFFYKRKQWEATVNFKLKRFIIWTEYYEGDQTKENGIGKSLRKNVYKIVVEKPTLMLEDNIKTHIREMWSMVNSY